MSQRKQDDDYIGPLNIAPTYSLAPGKRDHDIMVTEDGRILKLRDNDRNWLLIEGAWYEYRTEEAISFGADYPITEVPEVDFNPLSGFFPEELPDIATGYRVDFGGFSYIYRTLDEATEKASSHKQKFGGIGGSYHPAGWYRVRILSKEEEAAINKKTGEESLMEK